MREVSSGIGVELDLQRRSMERPANYIFVGELTRKRMLLRSLSEFTRMGELASWHTHERKVVRLDPEDPRCIFCGILTDTVQESDGRVMAAVMSRGRMHGHFPQLQGWHNGQRLYCRWEGDRQALSLDPSSAVLVGCVLGWQGEESNLLLGICAAGEAGFPIEDLDGNTMTYPVAENSDRQMVVPVRVPDLPAFSPASAADILCVHRSNVSYWMSAGKLTAYRDNLDEPYITRGELVRFVREYLGKEVSER